MLLQYVKIGENARSYPLPSPVWAEIAANTIVDAVQGQRLLRPDRPTRSSATSLTCA